MKGMHVIFNGVNVNGRQICEIEHSHVQKKKKKKKKRIKLAFEIGLPVNEAQFSKPVTKNDSFFVMLILVNINGKWHKQNRCIL